MRKVVKIQKIVHTVPHSFVCGRATIVYYFIDEYNKYYKFKAPIYGIQLIPVKSQLRYSKIAQGFEIYFYDTNYNKPRWRQLCEYVCIIEPSSEVEVMELLL